MDYEIVLVVFEVMTDDNNFTLEGLPSLYTILPNRILTMRRLITSPVDMNSMWSEATHEFMEKLPESLLENLLEKVERKMKDNSEYRAFMEDKWNIVIMNEIKGILKEEESVNENVMKTMTKRGYAVMKVPDELFAALLETIQRKMPRATTFRTIFTCAANYSKLTREQKGKWILNDIDQRTYSDGKRKQGRLSSFENLQVKRDLEEWLEDQTNLEDYIMADFKIIKGNKGVERQQLHTDFVNGELNGYQLFFGILTLKDRINLFVVPKNGVGEEEIWLEPGGIILGEGNLMHAGGTSTEGRLHFLYLHFTQKKTFGEYDYTTFIDNE